MRAFLELFSMRYNAAVPAEAVAELAFHILAEECDSMSECYVEAVV
ncbi:hypothetical protein P186_2361 [Pyrobaculum ferrireducens]|uniref:Uncharacterized protein n=1 Tax=Pyrobaculum ferrireducens TaxID=1104324 RepID=G7VC63_9CREN|nr:hypothetical protein P186_2361 [Pyrobaculum ferrireducens]